MAAFLSTFLFSSWVVRYRNAHHKLRAKQRRYLRATTVRGGLRAEIVHLGRRSGKDAVYDSACDVYKLRLRGKLDITERWGCSGKELANLAKKCRTVLLHERGVLPPSSLHFSRHVYGELFAGNSRLCIAIGADEGFPKEIENLDLEKLSLGPLTLTHKMARLFLIEQLYRAQQIEMGTKYHK